jgi:hypothetical protein
MKMPCAGFLSLAFAEPPPNRAIKSNGACFFPPLLFFAPFASLRSFF